LLLLGSGFDGGLLLEDVEFAVPQAWRRETARAFCLTIR
jgi:hypothetical protein